MKPNYHDAWERLVLYLPLIAMGVLALASYWLVRSTPNGSGEAELSARRHEVDYFFQAFTVKKFDATGLLRTQIQGEAAHHYTDTLSTEIEHIQARSLSSQGRLTTTSAQQANVNDAMSHYQLAGQAVVVRSALVDNAGKTAAATEYRSDLLDVDTDQDHLSSSKPVELLHGADRFWADRLDFDNAHQVLLLRGRVKAQLAPRSEAK